MNLENFSSVNNFWLFLVDSVIYFFLNLVPLSFGGVRGGVGLPQPDGYDYPPIFFSNMS